MTQHGPQHPSTHGCCACVELKGEEVISLQPVVGYLHTGIEKSAEFRTWVQGVTFVTRMDYLAPIFNETAYCLAVEKLLGIEPPPRATALRVLMMELNRISSHLVWLATTGLELGALSIMLYGFREREEILDILEDVTGLRMNHAWVRPAGSPRDLPRARGQDRAFVRDMRGKADEYETLLPNNPIWLELTGDATSPRRADRPVDHGPMLRAAGLDHDLRKAEPYCGYEQYEFLGAQRPRVRRLRPLPGPAGRRCVRASDRRAVSWTPCRRAVMSEDPKIGWGQAALGPTGWATPRPTQHIMGESMEALIPLSSRVTEGNQCRGAVLCRSSRQRGELGYHVISDGGNLPLRVTSATRRRQPPDRHAHGDRAAGRRRHRRMSSIDRSSRRRPLAPTKGGPPTVVRCRPT